MKKILISLLIFSLHLNAQSRWKLVSRSPYESFRNYTSANSLTGIYNDENDELITYHSSAFSGLIVRVKTNLKNNTIKSQEINWIDENSPMRGGGFDIQKLSDNNLYLYGIGSIKNEFYDYIGVTIFKMKINPQNDIVWNDINNTILRKKIFNTNYNSWDNNGVVDKYGNYFFCNNGNNKNLYSINMNDPNLITPDLVLSQNEYIKEFKKITTDEYTYIIGIENNRQNFIYIKSNNFTGNFLVFKKSLKTITNSNNSNEIKLQSETSFDISINNNFPELVFFTNTKKLYSVIFTQNNIFPNGRLIFQTNSQNLMEKLNRVRGLISINNNKYLLITWGYNNFFFDGINLHEYPSSCNCSPYGVIIDKIPSINDNEIYLLTRQHQDNIDTDFKKTIFYKLKNINNEDINLLKYEVNLNEHLRNTNYIHGGGARIRSLAIYNNNLLYDGWENAYFKKINNSNNTNLTDKKFLNLTINSLIKTNENEFVAGLYYGAYIQRFKIINDTIVSLDFHKINDDFHKTTALAYDNDRKVYIGLYHNGQSNTNYCNIYSYDIISDSNNNNDITTPLFTIFDTNYVVALKVISYENDNKWLYGISQNIKNGIYKLFRKNLSQNLAIEEINIPINNCKIKDMEIIKTPINKNRLFFITNNNSGNGGEIYDMKNFENNFTSSNIKHLRHFNNRPINLTTFLNRHLILTFNNKEIGYLRQNNTADIISFEDLPLPIDHAPHTIITNDYDKHLYVGTNEGVGSQFANNEGGGVFKIELPSYMDFNYQTRYHWGLHPRAILSGDYNGDGYDDILSLTDYNGTSKWNIKLNNKSLSFNPMYSFFLSSSNSDFVFSGDFNGDGYDDIGIVKIKNISNKNYEWTFYLNDKNGNFNSHHQFKYIWRKSPSKIVIGDYNGDGYDDISIFIENVGWYIKFNMHNKNFSEKTIQYKWEIAPDFVFSGDFNGDGYDDIGVKFSNIKQKGQNTKNNNIQNKQNIPTSPWVIRFNNHYNKFINPKNYDLETFPDYVTVGDFNGDNLSDLCLNLHTNITSMSLGEWVFRYNYGYYNLTNLNSKNIFQTNSAVFLSNTNTKKNKKNKVYIYPNPSNSFISIYTSNIIKKIEIINKYNNIVIEKKNCQNNCPLNISTLKSGIYFIIIYFDNNFIIKKIIIN